MTIEGDRWSCPWEPDEELSQTAIDGSELVIQARATDVHNRESEWTELLRLIVDMEPPLVQLSTESEAALADGFLSASELNLTGIVSDARQASLLQVCLMEEDGETY